MPKRCNISFWWRRFCWNKSYKVIIKKTKYNIYSLDDYSSGNKTNHVKSSRVKYIKGKTVNIDSLIKNPLRIKSVFHFGEFARIYQSFIKMNEYYELKHRRIKRSI